MARDSLSVDLANCETTEEAIKTIIGNFKNDVENIRETVHHKLSDCEGDLFDLFIQTYDETVQSVLDAAEYNMRAYVNTIDAGRESFATAHNNVKNIIG